MEQPARRVPAPTVIRPKVFAWFAAFLAIGKLKISLSIVATCLFLIVAAGLLIGRTTNADYSATATHFIKTGKPVVITNDETTAVR